MFPLADGNRVVVFGGYAKEKGKKEAEKGVTMADMFVLTPDSECVNTVNPQQSASLDLIQSNHLSSLKLQLIVERGRTPNLGSPDLVGQTVPYNRVLVKIGVPSADKLWFSLNHFMTMRCSKGFFRFRARHKHGEVALANGEAGRGPALGADRHERGCGAKQQGST